jgi:hypothetical protein
MNKVQNGNHAELMSIGEEGGGQNMYLKYSPKAP